MPNETFNSGKQILDADGNGIVDSFENEFSQAPDTGAGVESLGWGQEYAGSAPEVPAELDSQYQDEGATVGRIIPFKKPEPEYPSRLESEKIVLAEEAMSGPAFKEFASARLEWQANVIGRIAGQVVDLSGFRDQARAVISNAA
jgi:hypothetical protein